jgi:hypothetical protein
VKGWLAALRLESTSTKKAIDAAAVKAEATILVDEIRHNLDALEELVESLPETRDPIDDNPPT